MINAARNDVETNLRCVAFLKQPHAPNTKIFTKIRKTELFNLPDGTDTWLLQNTSHDITLPSFLPIP